MEETKEIANWYCPACGGEIVFTFERPSITYSLVNGKVQVASNFIEPEGLVFHCENDREHIIEPTSKKIRLLFAQWTQDVQDQYEKTTF